ncbi:MAG: hypothetical protein ACKOOI_02075 [Pirellula sp.]
MVWIDDSIDELPQDFIQCNIPKVIVGPSQPKETVPSDLWLPTGIMGVTHSANVFRGDKTILAKIPIQTKELQTQCSSPGDWLGRLVR